MFHVRPWSVGACDGSSVGDESGKTDNVPLRAFCEATFQDNAVLDHDVWGAFYCWKQNDTKYMYNIFEQLIHNYILYFS